MSVQTFGNSSSDAGANALTITVIAGSVLLLLMALASPMPTAAQPAAPVAKPAAMEQIVVVAAKPRHVS